ncbi:MAG: glycosyltransferase [Deltaproteobacteria bacterium]
MVILGLVGALVWLSSCSVFAYFGVRALWFHRLACSIEPAAAPPPLASFPLVEVPEVTLQIAVCGERQLVQGAVDSVLRLDYPTERWELQLCDDSSDGETIALCEELAARARERGFRVSHLVRPDRSGFKAGNLNAALPLARGELIAVLDVDHRLSPDFLRQLVPLLLADERLAAVQGRFTHRNAAAGIIAAAQQAMFDYHLEVEQPTRSAGRLWPIFNGSAGIWRKAALVAIGGWPMGTGVEDVQASFFAQTLGWRLAFSPVTVSTALLPERLEGFIRQQIRWAAGCGLILRRLGRPILRARAPLATRLEALRHLGGYSPHAAVAALALVSPFALWFTARLPRPNLAGGLAFGAYALMLLGESRLDSLAQRRAGIPTRLALPRGLVAGMLQPGIAPLIGPAFLLGLSGVSMRGWSASHGAGRLGGRGRGTLVALAALLSTSAGVLEAFRTGQPFAGALLLTVLASLAFTVAVTWLQRPAAQRELEAIVPSIDAAQ